MDVGQALSVPIIRQLRRWMSAGCSAAGRTARPVILDAPPGTACPVVATMSGADAVLLVTEPTPFGLHDLRIAAEVARDELRLPVAVVVNRSATPRQDVVAWHGVDRYCAEKGIPILMRIPLERRIAEAYSEGTPLVDALPAYRDRFRVLWQELAELQ
jgi:MinD superfamily P-loop ATPase